MKTPDQALALMLISQAEGTHPVLAARDYHIIQGRPTLKADSMLARFMTCGGTVKWTSYTDDKVEGIFDHPQGGTVTVDWTFERAKKAGLTGKDIWKSYPRQMLRARVISEGIRTVYPGVVAGIYTPEEVDDFDAKPPVEPLNVTPHIEIDDGMASEEQLSKIFALSKDFALSASDMKSLITWKFGVSSSKKLTRENAALLIEKMMELWEEYVAHMMVGEQPNS
jgi:hypothetical protein